MDTLGMTQTNRVEFHPIPKAGYSLLDRLPTGHSRSGIPTRNFVQLEYIEDYIRRSDLSPLAPRSVAVENHYIDRDYMADYGVFFSSLLCPPSNHCQRLHFFAAEPAFVEDELVKLGNLLPQSDEAYRDRCAEFSRKYYLGFSVIRPLPGCPVGRTVLRLLPSQKEDGAQRILTCTRNYDVNFMGVLLGIQGLAFQQQDLAVSRCATIALWSALNITSARESITIPTPVEITKHASQTQLPFGRQMPSEGLSCGQMCFALQSVGVPPFLLKATGLVQTRQLIFASVNSGMPCVLLIHKATNKHLYHAVTVVGMKASPTHASCLDTFGSVDDLSGDVVALYVHDDRIGPYRRADIVSRADDDGLWLSIGTKSHRPNEEPEEWRVDQVIIPSHAKIRVGFNELESLARIWVVPNIQGAIAIMDKIEERRTQQSGFPWPWKKKKTAPTLQFKTWIERGHKYIQRVLSEQLLSDSVLFRKECVLPRYLAVMRFGGESFGQIDVLVDTTTPKPNYRLIGIVALNGSDPKGETRRFIADHLAKKYQCKHWQ